MTEPNAVQPVATPGASPFDAIRRTRPDGSEYWSARELQPLLGYDRWQRFDETINRAKISAQMTGINTRSAFAQVAQLTDAGNLGEQARIDYELTRHAAYLVAMCGDVRKAEIADAQLYFAVKAREAEVKAELTERDQALMLARQLIAADERATRAEAEVTYLERRREIDAPKVEVFEEFMDDGGMLTLAAVGKMRHMPGPQKIFNWLQMHGFLRLDGLPIQRYREQNLFAVGARGEVLVTAKGRARLFEVRMGELRGDQGRI